MAQAPPVDQAREVRSPGLLLVGLAGLLAFDLFFLVRPLFEAAPAYRPRPAGTTYAYSFLVVAAFAPFALAVRGAGSTVRVRWALAGTAILHVLVLPAALTQSQDLYAYLFYGKMWAVHGANPYVDLPLRFSADPWFPWMRWPNQVSVYGPLWTLLTGGVAALSTGSLAWAFALSKALVGVLGVATVSGLIRAARHRGVPAGWALVMVAWNPLVIVSLPLGGHADVAVTAAWAWALVADRRGRTTVATLLLAAATLVKAYAGVVLVVYLLVLARRRARVGRAAGAAVALAGLAYAPFWEGWRTFTGLAEIGSRASASLGGGVQLLLGTMIPETAAAWIVRAAGLAVIALVIARGASSDRFASDPWPAATAAFVAYLVVTPWFLYWHLVGALVLSVLAASQRLRAGVFAFSGTAMLTASFGSTWWGRVVQTSLRYGIPAAAFIRARRAGAGTPPRSLPRPGS
jgi:Glycosyltransferase family 87